MSGEGGSNPPKAAPNRAPLGGDGRPAPVAIPERVLMDVYREARLAYPFECCGWLAGPRAADQVDELRACVNRQEIEDHPTSPDRTAETAYLIAGDDLLALARSLDGARPARVLYHSHPNGRAYLSRTDVNVATSPWGDGPTYPVQQLVVGVDADAVREAALFAWSDAAGGFVEVARFEGADI